MYDRQRAENLISASPTIASTATATRIDQAPLVEPPCEAGGEMKPLIYLAVPIVVSTFCAAILPLTSLVYAARLGDNTALAGISLGVSVCNVSGICIYYGMATGIDTLASQAFGANKSRLVGVVFARGTLLTAAIFFAPVAILWYYMESVLVALGQDPEVAEVTGSFTRAYLWGMAPYVVFENVKRCLQAQNIAVPEMIVGLIGVIANIGFHQLTMGTLGLGAYGAGLALSMTGILMLGVFIAAIWLFKLGGKDWWSGICSPEVFSCWLEYLRLCIPGLAGIFVEWTAWEASIFIAGMAGREELAIQGILLSAYGLVFSAALAISIGANNRVGNRLGELKPDSAREAAWCTIRLAIGSALVLGGGLGLGARLWPQFVGVSKSDIKKIFRLAPWYAVIQILDIVQIACTGILKGMGLQCVQAKATFVSFYLAAVPLMAYLVLGRKWGVRGLWIGMGAAELPLVSLYLYVIYNANWKELAKAAQCRIMIHSEHSNCESFSSGAGGSDPEEGGGGDEMDVIPDGGDYGSGGGTAAAGGLGQETRAQILDDGGGIALREKSKLVVLVLNDLPMMIISAPVGPLNC